jgi:hypothetical protein
MRELGGGGGGVGDGEIPKIEQIKTTAACQDCLSAMTRRARAAETMRRFHWTVSFTSLTLVHLTSSHSPSLGHITPGRR